jgi:hypothetical protein
MFCCNKNCENKDVIEYKYSGGIRGCGQSRRITFCTDHLETFKKTELCQVCRCYGYKGEFINEYKVCSADSQYADYESPLCIEKYTGNFKCGKCNTNRNVRTDGTCYILKPPDGTDYINMCSICIEPYINEIKKSYDVRQCLKRDEKWCYIMHDDYENLMKLIENDKKFCCNKCHDIKSCRELNIFGHENVCDNCKSIY